MSLICWGEPMMEPPTLTLFMMMDDGGRAGSLSSERPTKTTLPLGLSIGM
jgi:hypothetical protein